MVTRHPEMKLEMEIARSARGHQREIAAAFEEARHLHYLRHQALRRSFPIRCSGAMNYPIAAGLAMLRELDRLDHLAEHTHAVFGPGIGHHPV